MAKMSPATHSRITCSGSSCDECCGYGSIGSCRCKVGWGLVDLVVAFWWWPASGFAVSPCQVVWWSDQADRETGRRRKMEGYGMDVPAVFLDMYIIRGEGEGRKES